MKASVILITLAILLIQCKQKSVHRDFFVEMKNYPVFNTSQRRIHLFRLDSIALDTVSILIGDKNYWYLNSSARGLLKINGYLRGCDNMIYIKTGDKFNANKEAQEQILFDFTDDTSKIRVIKYKRNRVPYSLRLAKEDIFYNQQVKDTVTVFRAYSEADGFSEYDEFLIQASFRKGLISFVYLSRGEKRIYTIDYLPVPNVIIENVTTPIYRTE